MCRRLCRSLCIAERCSVKAYSHTPSLISTHLFSPGNDDARLYNHWSPLDQFSHQLVSHLSVCHHRSYSLRVSHVVSDIIVSVLYTQVPIMGFISVIVYSQFAICLPVYCESFVLIHAVFTNMFYAGLFNDNFICVIFQNVAYNKLYYYKVNKYNISTHATKTALILIWV